MISHLDADHYKGIVSICRAGMVKKIAVTESLKEEISRISRETGMKKEDILFIKTGTKFYSGKEFAFKILGPVQEGKDANANSMVVKLIWKKFSIMAPGDIDMEAEASLLERYETNKLKSDILSAPHHGSKYSSSEEFIKDVNPQFAIVQSGKNNRYGHPAPESLKDSMNTEVKSGLKEGDKVVMSEMSAANYFFLIYCLKFIPELSRNAQNQFANTMWSASTRYPVSLSIRRMA